MMETYKKNQFIKELKDQEGVDSVFLVKFSSVAVGKTGKPYMTLVLLDRSGEVEARIWDQIDKYAGQIVQDAFIWVKGKCQSYQGRRQIVIKEVKLLREDEVETKDFVVDKQLDVRSLYEELLKFVASMEDPFYRALAEVTVQEDPDIVDRIQRAPAAKSVHHAYKGGLLEHVVSILKTLDFLAKHYHPYVDRDLLFLGGIFHDIGKLWELSYGRLTDYTDEGRLVGHLVMGVELVERKIQKLESEEGRLPGKFPEEKKLLVKHVILAHHGKLEYGSPKRPKCLEALIVHYIDDLDSKVNAIRDFILGDLNPGKWTALNRKYERFFFKPPWAEEV